MDVVKWMPLRELEAMDRRMRRVFDETLPAVDAYETDDEFVVELEAPGFEENELVLEVFDHTLSIKGERREEKEKEDTTFRLRERIDASFERRFALPAETNTEAIKAHFDKGVLAIHAPKAETVRPRRVPIGK